jgi:type VI secretion system protein ImpK
VRFALYALVVFLDESVLNSQQPMFAAWPSRPLQEEVFGGHMGGELFFQYLTQLLAREDSDDLADVLEVYQLCLLLGFQGRFTGSTSGELQVLSQRVGERIARIRGPLGELSPAWKPPADAIGAPLSDPWLRKLAIGAGVAAAFSLAIFLGYRASLGSGVEDVRAAVASAATAAAPTSGAR